MITSIIFLDKSYDETSRTRRFIFRLIIRFAALFLITSSIVIPTQTDLGNSFCLFARASSNAENKKVKTPLSILTSHIADNEATAINTQNDFHARDRSDDRGDTLCDNCRLASKSLENLLRQPRQMSSYGQLEERIDLSKIKKAICRDVVNDLERERCRNFFFTHSKVIETWKLSGGKTTFFDSVCIRELKICCPRNSFGSKCTKCPKCGVNEQCQGEGTRSGSGECICKDGHTGLNCTSCLPKYYPEVKKIGTEMSEAIACLPCHKSCLYCRSEGSLGCEVCSPGYNWVPAYGCSDIDECFGGDRKICGDNTFCVNTEGSYFCYECDRACNGCLGDGPDMCLKCASGYKLEHGNCIAMKKTILPPEANYYRYAIYTGLCICTCIILHNNIYLASLVGIGVAMYIGVSEYIMSTHMKELIDHGVSLKPGIETGSFAEL